MASRQRSRNPSCPIFATKLKEIDRLPRLDVNVKGFSTFTDNADEFGDLGKSIYLPVRYSAVSEKLDR